jgi:hypothetical protein
MKMFKKILLASALLVSTTVASHAAVLFSDDFSSSTLGLGLSPFTNAPVGWTVDYGSVDVIGPSLFEMYLGNGKNVDMNGSTGQSGGMHTNTVFSFLAGKTYTLSFNYGNNIYSAGNPGSSESLAAIIGGLTVGSITEFNAIENYKLALFTFIAASNFSSAIYLNASGSDDTDNGGLILDNVSLSVVPVPAALPLLAAGLGVLGFAGRRRRAKAAV